MKILHIQRVSGIAGSEKYIVELSKQLQKRGITSNFLCVYNQVDSPIVEKYFSLLSEESIFYYEIIENKKVSFGLIKKIYAIVKKNNYDLIHTHLIYADIYAVLLKLLFPSLCIKILSTKHGYNEAYFENEGVLKPYFPFFSAYYYTALLTERFIDRSYAVSHGIKKVFTYLKICKKSIEVIHHGISIPEFSVSLSSQKRFGKIQLLVVGRFAPLKGHLYLVESIHLLKEKYSSTELKIVFVGGDSGFEHKIREKVNTLGLSEYFSFEGFQKCVYSYYRSSDIIVIPSKSEAFGLIFLEAFACKKPTIAFDVPAANEIISHAKNGILVPPFSTKSMAIEIDKLIGDELLRVRLGKNAFETLVNYFTVEKMVEKTIALYKKVLNGN